MKKTIYEFFFEAIEELTGEFATNDFESFVKNYPMAPLFKLEESLPEVPDHLSVTPDLAPYSYFFLETPQTLIFYRFEGESIFVNVINSFVDGLMSVFFSGEFKGNKLVRLKFEPVPTMTNIILSNREYCEKLLNTWYSELRNFVYYLKTPVLRITKIDVPKKRRKKYNQKEFVAFNRVQIRKEYFVNSNKKETENLGTKRFHDVRPSWKTYTPDRPLFGKYTGTFFFSSHKRGDLKKGIVFKEYVVKSPKP